MAGRDSKVIGRFEKSVFLLIRAGILQAVLAAVLLPLCANGQDYLVVKKELPRSKEGWLVLQADLPVHRVYIDSLELTHLPEKPFPLEAGRHIIRAVADPLANWFIRDAKDTVKISPGDTLRRVLHFPRYRILDSRPFGAGVYQNDRFLGKTPLLVPEDALAGGAITLKMRGYLPARAGIYSPEKFRITVPLVPEAAYWRRVRLQKIAYAGKLRRQRRIAAFSLGTSVVFGTAAYFLKKEANRSFARYLRAGNPRDMDRYFSRTLWLDRAAAGTYLTFEAGLLLSAYLYFRSLLGE